MHWPIRRDHPKKKKARPILLKKKTRVVPFSGNTQPERFVNGVDFIIVPLDEWEEEDPQVSCQERPEVPGLADKEFIRHSGGASFLAMPRILFFDFARI